jgi:hypothetical protein
MIVKTTGKYCSAAQCLAPLRQCIANTFAECAKLALQNQLIFGSPLGSLHAGSNVGFQACRCLWCSSAAEI